MVLLALLCLSLAGCPTPIPYCKDRRTYVPGIVIGDPDAADGAAHRAIVAGRMALGPPVLNGLISVRLAQLDGDVVIAATETSLPPDGRFYWALAPGTYVISDRKSVV